LGADHLDGRVDADGGQGASEIVADVPEVAELPEIREPEEARDEVDRVRGYTVGQRLTVEWIPPAAAMISPVMARDASDARNTTTSATSSGVDRRRVGIRPSTASATPGLARFSRHIAVSTTPGATEFARMPRGPYSIARARVMPSSAALVAA